MGSVGWVASVSRLTSDTLVLMGSKEPRLPHVVGLLLGSLLGSRRTPGTTLPHPSTGWRLITF